MSVAVLLSACGDDSTPFDMLPEEDAGEVIKEDAGPPPTFPDRGAPTDRGFPEDEGFPDFDAGAFDTGVRDTGVRDTGVRDTGAFDTGVRDTGPLDTGPAYDPCATSAVIDLNAMGTLAGETTSYTGSNASTGRSAPLRPACGSASSIGHQVAFRYVPRAGVRLRVSTDNAGTAVNLDTVVWAQAACASLPSGNSGLGCDDDSGNDPRGFSSVFTTSAAVTAGTPVYIIVAGYDGASTTTPTGAFALTVTEVYPGMTGAACDPREVTPAPCVAALRCVPTGTSTTVGTCLADGTAGARCRSAGLACDAGLTCSGAVTSTASRCRATVAVGGACDPAGAANVCAAGSHCITASGASTCVAEGTAGGRCRSTGMACDATLVCSGAVSSTSSRCRGTIAVGAACDAAGTGDPCVTGSTCLTVAGNTTCVADGTANGRCRASGVACDAGLGCTGTQTATASRCVMAVAVGGACPTGSICVAGSTCLSAVCVADGSLNGRCRASGMACDAGLGCNGTQTATASRCVMAVPVGGACTAASVCASGSRCLASGGGMICVADGGAGNFCRADAPRCNTSLTCSSAYTNEGWCLSTVASGATCDWTGRSTLCPTGEGCVATSATAGSCARAQAEAEDNNPINPPMTTSTTGAAFTGSITAGDRDCFGLTVPAGASIYAQVQLPMAPGCPIGGADPVITLYRLAASGTGSSTVTSQDDSDGFGLCPMLNPTVQTNARNVSAGSYAVCVTGLRSTTTVPDYLLSFGYYR
ncbi:MAG: hypothetical protein Q8S73_32460 [Deltaproteobacteria bacterium]|nr:hypothetical protein [Deltaproteobacteria bacterium]